MIPVTNNNIFTNQFYQEMSSQTSSIPCSWEWQCISEPSLPNNCEIISSFDNTISTLTEPDVHNVSIQNSNCYYTNSYLPRSNIEIRYKYLQSLKNQGLLSQKPQKKCHHMTIFDWDDTLLCTSYLSTSKITETEGLRESEKSKLQQIDNRNIEILAISLELSSVCIITNSISGWVQYSAKIFIPKTFNFIKTHHIQIISARSKYSEDFPDDTQRWKLEAFYSLFKNIHKNVILNLICVGDSKIQIDAAQKIGVNFEKKFVKTLKLREKPHLDQLVKQLKLISTKIKDVISATKSMAIRLEHVKKM